MTLPLIGLLAALGFDPAIDQAREPPSGPAITVGIERLDDALGGWAELRSPRLLQDQLAIALAGGVGWFPGILPATEREAAVGPWSPYGTLRLRGELAAPVAESPHRAFVALGPSLLFPASELSSTPVGIGVSGGLGVELFLGSRLRTAPYALVVELGAVAHLARADARSGEAETAAPLGTGFMVSVGFRAYPFGAD